MAVNIIDWFKFKLGGKSAPGELKTLYSDGDEMGLAATAEEMALQSCSGLIGGTLGKCEFVTFADGTPQKRKEWRLWNIAPNANESAQMFRSRLADRLVRNGDVLAIEIDGMLYIADSFTCDNSVIRERIYSNIQVGTVSLNRTFRESEVMRFVFSRQEWAATFARFANDYAQIINSGVKGYRRAQGLKGTLSLDAQLMNNSKAIEAYENIRNAGFRRFADAESAVLSLYKGMEYNDISQKAYSTQNSRDIRAMLDDITDYGARMLGIPPQLLNGSVQDTSVANSQFIDNCILPITRMLECEINRKRYRAQDISAGSGVRIDVSDISHADWISAAEGIDKLIASGVYSVNEVRERLGMPLIDSAWANEHYITKNYEDLQSRNKSEKVE